MTEAERIEKNVEKVYNWELGGIFFDDCVTLVKAEHERLQQQIKALQQQCQQKIDHRDQKLGSAQELNRDLLVLIQSIENRWLINNHPYWTSPERSKLESVYINKAK